MFFNEVDLLKIRLSELTDHVDYFVIAEATETFQGNPKPLNFQQNKAQFSEYLHKIIYIPIDKHYGTNDPWKREAFQRNQILRGLKKCQREDLILLSDLDEIPFAHNIERIESMIDEKEIIFVNHLMFRFHLNRFDPAYTPWPGTVASRYATFRRYGPEKMRQNKHGKFSIEGGWHFSWLGGYDSYIEKLESYSHTEYNEEKFKTREYFEAEVRKYPLIPINRSYPKYVLQNLNELCQKGLIR